MVAFTFGLTSCSSDDHEPIPEPEEEVILTPIPDGAEPGKIYAIKHDKKNDTCTFQFYFGDNSTEEMKEIYSNSLVSLSIHDSTGRTLFSYTLHSPDFEHNSPSGLWDTFSLPCYICERIHSFEFEIYWMDDARCFNQTVSGNQQYRSPHIFFD